MELIFCNKVLPPLRIFKENTVSNSKKGNSWTVLCDDNLIGINIESPMVTILKDQIFLGQRISNTFHKKFILWFYFYIYACKWKAFGTHTNSHTPEDTLLYLIFGRYHIIFPNVFKTKTHLSQYVTPCEF